METNVKEEKGRTKVFGFVFVWFLYFDFGFDFDFFLFFCLSEDVVGV